MKPYIVDVYLSVTDETYYPLDGRSEYNEAYAARSRTELIQFLKEDGWKWCGKVLASDERTTLEMFSKTPTAAERHLVNGSFTNPKEHIIAVGEEA